MTIDPIALARMTLYAVLFGIGLELFLELLRIIWGLISPLTLETDSSHDTIPLRIALCVRDLLFFICGGIAFSVFVYYTNNGKVRFVAVTATLIGFFACYLTLGRVIRRLSELIIRALYKLIYYLLFPLRFVAGQVSRLLSALYRSFSRRATVSAIKRDIRRARKLCGEKTKDGHTNGQKQHKDPVVDHPSGGTRVGAGTGNIRRKRHGV